MNNKLSGVLAATVPKSCKCLASAQLLCTPYFTTTVWILMRNNQFGNPQYLMLVDLYQQTYLKKRAAILLQRFGLSFFDFFSWFLLISFSVTPSIVWCANKNKNKKRKNRILVGKTKTDRTEKKSKIRRRNGLWLYLFMCNVQPLHATIKSFQTNQIFVLLCMCTSMYAGLVYAVHTTYRYSIYSPDTNFTSFCGN